MKPIKQTATLLLVALLLTSAAPASAMVMHIEGNQLIVTGPLSGLELTQFMSAQTPNVTTVVFVDSRGGDTEAGVNFAEEIRRRGLTTVAVGIVNPVARTLIVAAAV
jgi:ATP-dependent protease ClpP protease subunit